MLAVTSVQGPPQGPPPRVIVSTVPASATTTEEHVPDALFLPSSLFSADVGFVIDMAYYIKPADTPLLRLAKMAVAAAAGRWQVALGDGD
jgi:pentafunctional AROM polypeptide